MWKLTVNMRYFYDQCWCTKNLIITVFLAVPLTSVNKHGPWYVSFSFHAKQSVAVLSQIRCVSVARLHAKMGEIDEHDFMLIKQGFLALYK